VQHEEPAEVGDGPVPVLTRVVERWQQQLLAGLVGNAPIWGIGIGLPGPVEFATGRPVAPPAMPGWDDFDVRTFFGDHFRAPVWVDNEVNVMALGELRAGLAQGQADLVYVKVGTGIGAGLVTKGSLHRGAQGCAGDIGHVTVDDSATVLCRCGKYGCLEALAGGAAIARDAERAAREGRSTFLAAALDRDGKIEAQTVSDAATHGDPVAIDLLAQSARLVGVTMARMVNFFNPRSFSSGEAFHAPMVPISPRSGTPSSADHFRWPPAPCRSAGPPWGTRPACAARRSWWPMPCSPARYFRSGCHCAARPAAPN